MKLEIKGHSGCGLDIIENEDGTLCVKKYTDKKNYFERLQLQATKQAYDNCARLVNGVSVPDIFERGLEEDGNRYYVLMQYIHAKNFVDFFEHASKEDIDHTVNMICEYITKELEQSEVKEIDKSVFLDKLDSIEKNCYENEMLKQKNFMTEVKSIISDSRKEYMEMPQVLRIPVGKCHGDLTFSNLLFSKNKMYIIDYLDSFIETPIQDIVKVRQDTMYHWSLLMYDKSQNVDSIRHDTMNYLLSLNDKPNIDNIRIFMTFKYIDDCIDRYFSKSKYREYYQDLYRCFQLMNLLRILPYVKEERVYDHLIKSIKSIIYGKK